MYILDFQMFLRLKFFLISCLLKTMLQFMEQEGGSNLLQFWIAVENFEKHLHSCEGGYDGMEAQSDAMVLYDK